MLLCATLLSFIPIVFRPRKPITTGTKQWVHNPSMLSLPCCAWDEAERHLNDPQYCTANFSIDDSGVYYGALQSLAYSGGHSCSCVWFRNQLSYRDSELPEWDAKEFCFRLGSRTIMLIGDSTMQQTASALMSSVTHSLWEKGCQNQIVFAPGDTLVGRSFGVLNRGAHWTHWVGALRPGDIVVLSAGPHLMVDDDTFKIILDEVVQAHNTSFPHLRLIWRSQFPGGCGENDSSYNYAHFPTWDRLAAATTPDFLDISALYARPDAHVGANVTYPTDCLHFCMPVLYDLVARLFLRIL